MFAANLKENANKNASSFYTPILTQLAYLFITSCLPITSISGSYKIFFCMHDTTNLSCCMFGVAGILFDFMICKKS